MKIDRSKAKATPVGGRMLQGAVKASLPREGE